MTFARTIAVGLMGLVGHVVDVEAHIADGLPAFYLVGLPDASLGEAPKRIKAACASQGVSVSSLRITVNLSPASLPKHGSGFDLAIAAAVLAAHRVMDAGPLTRTVHLGEVGLDGRLRPVRGVLPAVHAAVRAGFHRIVVPAANAEEARLVPGADVRGAVNLADVVRLHGGPKRDFEIPPPHGQQAVAAPVLSRPDRAEPGDLSAVVGQEQARLGLEVAAAGGHHVLMVGPPGAGKTMLASRLPGLLPDLDEDDAIAVTSVHSVAGTLSAGADLIRRPPFEDPHHGATAAAVIGGGSGYPRPGAASRAHAGVLFLDEAPEFRRDVLDALRQPLETGQLSVARARGSVRFPARFQLVLAANPCPCGRSMSADADCTCTPMQRRGYLSRLSGPILDRIDVRLEVRPPSRAQLQDESPGESTEVVAKRVRIADEAARHRWGGRRTASVPGPVLRSEFRLPREITAELDRSLDRGLLTVRGYDRVLRMAWTLADLDGVNSPGRDQVGLALSLRAATSTVGLRS